MNLPVKTTVGPDEAVSHLHKRPSAGQDADHSSGNYFWNEIERFGGDLALLVNRDTTVTYRDLARMADAFVDRLPAGSQLIALQACNAVEAIVAYLGCLRHCHPVILLGPESLNDGRIVETYRPNFLYLFEDGEWRLIHLTAEPAACTGELAVLLSTSGTTGAPKLVKLSHTNIDSNARAIARYLELSSNERAITTLSFYYSYGMAVVNSHLSVGARIVLTQESLVSDGFWELFHANEVTSLALVPYQFEFLTKIGFKDMSLPSLHYITQAGGRLAADKIREYAQLSQTQGWRLFIMYGQTEASPRISYIPPADLLENLDAIGRPVPGGEIVLLNDSGGEIDAANEIGELVYRGPNVMLGYAENRGDLATPRDVTELRTGDLAVRKANGYFKIVGRLKRFIKLYGLRINLDDVEIFLTGQGHRVYCSGTDELLVVFHVDGVDEAAIAATLNAKYNIQKSHIAFRQLPEIPLMPTGKVDYRKLKEESESIQVGERSAECSISDAFRDILGEKEISPGDSFVSVGGDSLSFLNMSLFLEKKLGYLPGNWPRMTVAQIAALQPSRSFFMKVPIDAILRVIACIFVISSHIYVDHIFFCVGGANVLMMLAGFSMVKYQGERLKTSSVIVLAKSLLGRILLIYYAVVIPYFVIFWDSSAHFFPRWVLLYANFYPFSTHLYPYWFISAYVHIILAVILFWRIPLVRRKLDGREHIFGYGLLGFGMLAACALKLTEPTPAVFLSSTFSQVHLFALGWCVYHARTLKTKILVLGLAVTAALAFWPNIPVSHYARIYFITGATIALLWIDGITMPRKIGSRVVWMASLSFYIYIVHIAPGFFAQYVPNMGSAVLTHLIWAGAILVSILMASSVAWAMPRIERWTSNRGAP